jgi:hypothetical protein
LALALTLALMAAKSGTAAAEDKDSDAERLFREGQKLMEERNFGAACPKFEAAYTKDRALGTLINLAFCHKEQGAIWYAWLEFREAESKAIELNRADRRDFAKQRLAELEQKLPKVVIDNPQKIPLTDVLVEDRKVWEAERGAVFAAESGERKLTFRARGKKQATKIINVVGKGDKVQHVSLPEMEDGADEPPPVERALPPVKDKDKVEPSAKRDSNAGSTQRTLGWVAVGIGGVAAVVGTITGISTLQNQCAGNKCPLATRKPAEEEAIDSANTSGAISTVSFVLAVLGVGGGLALVFTAPTASGTTAIDRSTPMPRKTGVAISPQIGAGWAGLSGTF